MATKKKMKGFDRREVLFVDTYAQDASFEKAYRAYRSHRDDARADYQKYWSEFNPSGKEDYSDTFTQANLEKYWQDQTKNNNFKGTLEDFIRDYGLELDVWFINCGYDFSGVKEIILGS